MLNIFEFQTVPTVSIKISWILHKNVWVYRVEFLCAKKQSFLRLEVWCTSFPFSFFMVNSEDLFPLPALTHCGLSTVRSPLKEKKNPCEHKSAQSCTWCKVNLEDSVNLLFICKWGELYSGFFPGKCIQAPTFGTHTCLPRKHVFLSASWMEYYVFRFFFHWISWSQTAINPSTLCRL